MKLSDESEIIKALRYAEENYEDRFNSSKFVFKKQVNDGGLTFTWSFLAGAFHLRGWYNFNEEEKKPAIEFEVINDGKEMKVTSWRTGEYWEDGDQMTCLSNGYFLVICYLEAVLESAP